MYKSTLQTLREQRGLTQEEVADAMHVSTNTIQNWEKHGCPSRKKLKALLDFYEADDVTRLYVLIEIFNGGYEFHSVSFVKAFSANALRNTVQEAAKRAKKNPGRIRCSLDTAVACVTVVDEKMKCLNEAMHFAEDFYSSKVCPEIVGEETAYNLDLVGREYGVKFGAMGVYQIQEYNRAINEAYPFGDLGPVMVEDVDGQPLDYSEFQDLMLPDVDMDRSSKEEIWDALQEMKKDYDTLDVIRTGILSFMTQDPIWRCSVKLSALVDMEQGVFWEVVTVLDTGVSFLKTSSPEVIEYFLKSSEGRQKVSLDRRNLRRKSVAREIHFGGVFYDNLLVKLAYDILDKVLEPVAFMASDPVYSDSWIELCQYDKVLQDYIKEQSADQPVRPGEQK